MSAIWPTLGITGLFEWIRMPFVGFTGAPSTFQRMMQLVLRGCTPQFCLVHLDDILIFSKDMESHGKDLDVVLGKIRHAGLKISANKCQIGKDELVYLGHKLTPEGLKIDEGKITKVLDFPKPHDMVIATSRRWKGKTHLLFQSTFRQTRTKLWNYRKGMSCGHIWNFNMSTIISIWTQIPSDHRPCSIEMAIWSEQSIWTHRSVDHQT